MRKSARISIIMPAYNGQRHIADSIQSVLDQTDENWELVVVDDGSTDDTAGVVRSFSHDQRIKYLRRSNGGQAAARNTGIAAATGDLVAFLDQDDLWLPDKLRLQRSVIERERVDVVFSDGFVFYENGKPGASASSTESFPMIHGRVEGAEMYRRLFLTNWIAILTVLVRRESLEKVKGFDANPRYQNCEDYDLWLRLAHSGALFYGMPECLAKYRSHAASASGGASVVKLLQAELAVLERHRSLVGLPEPVIADRVWQVSRNLVFTLIELGRLREAEAQVHDIAHAVEPAHASSLYMMLASAAVQRDDLFTARRCCIRALRRRPATVVHQHRPLLAQVMLGRSLGTRIYSGYLQLFRGGS